VGVNTVLSAQPAATPVAPDGGVAFPGELPGIIIVADPQDRGGQAPILAPQARLAQAATANITVTYLPSRAAWPSAAINAFEAAVSIWEGLVVSPVEIMVDAEWKDMGDPDILGGASSRNAWRDFTGAPTPGTWYVSALANKLAGEDLDPSKSDIYAQFNSTFNWYFGVTGSPALGSYDFMTVVLHELTHGLGMTGSLKVVNGTGGWGFVHTSSAPYYPFAYDRYAVNGSGSTLIDTNLYPNPSASLAAQLTSNNVYFGGANARSANSGYSPKLYAPNPWVQGSSFSHLDESFNNTANTLMTYAIGAREVVHNPGPIVLGIFKDLGWTASAQPNPTVTPTPKPPTPTPTRIATFTVRNRYWLPNIDRSYVNPNQPTPIPGGRYNLSGRMTLAGAGVVALLELRECPKRGSGCTTSASLNTNADGSYTFSNLTGPASDKFFYVRFSNSEKMSAALGYWFSEIIDSAPASGALTLPTYDVMNIAMLAPIPGATVSLPARFQWNKRSVAPSDNYWLEFFDSADSVPFHKTNLLGYVDAMTLASLPSGFLPATTYGWDVCAEGPNGAYGCSYYYRPITFNNTQAPTGSEAEALTAVEAHLPDERDRVWAETP
jgi:hypothetical protein